MEEFSLTTKEEADSDKKESDKKKKKRAGALGAFLVETKPEAPARQKKGTDELENRTILGKRQRETSKEKPEQNASAEEAPLEKLSPEETTMVRRLSAESKLAELQESAEAGETPEDAYGNLLVEDFLEQIAREAADPEEALTNTLAEAGISPLELEFEEASVPGEQTQPEAGGSEAPNGSVESESESEFPDDAPREFTEYETEIYLHETSVWTSDDEQAEETYSGGAGGTPPPPIRPTASGGGDSNQPPRRPRYGAVPGGFDSGLHQALPDRLRTEYLSNYNESGLLDAALVGGTGGVVGYLMGRRRGRIKAEKKLLPVQKRLEKQVKDLQGELQAQEIKLRKLAARRIRVHGPAVMGRFKEREAAHSHSSQAETSSHLSKTETLEPVPARQAAPEARRLHAQRHAPEHLGHMVVVGEAIPAALPAIRENLPRAEKVAGRPQRPGETIIKIDKNVATMNRAELLEVSDKIIVDGASLRQIYETHLVGERGLRRLVSEHLRGGNVKKLLRREIIEREIDFERDPAMRDQAAQAAGGGSGEASLKTMLDRAGANRTGSAEEAAFYKARAAYDARAQSMQRRQRRLVDISMTAIIAVLIVLILLLLVTRR